MGTIFYSIAIVCVCAAIISFFVARAVRHKKHLDNFKSEERSKTEVASVETVTPAEQPKEKLLEQKNEVFDAQMEDFSLAEEEPAKPTFKRETVFDSLEDDDDDDWDNWEDDEDFKKRFADYEDFLKNDMDTKDKESDSSDSEIDSLANFDFDSLKGKSEEEIADMIKHLPPKVQEIMMSEILTRKKYDDEED